MASVLAEIVVVFFNTGSIVVVVVVSSNSLTFLTVCVLDPVSIGLSIGAAVLPYPASALSNLGEVWLVTFPLFGLPWILVVVAEVHSVEVGQRGKARSLGKGCTTASGTMVIRGTKSVGSTVVRYN